MLVSPRKQKATVGVGEVLLCSLGSGKGRALPAVPDLHDKIRRKQLVLGHMTVYTHDFRTHTLLGAPRHTCNKCFFSCPRGAVSQWNTRPSQCNIPWTSVSLFV